MLKRLKKLFLSKSNPFPQSKHVIKHAFESGGVDYYEFDTTANLPWKRGLKFISVFNELEMKVDKKYLTLHTEAMDKILTGGKKIGLEELIQIRQLNNQLKDRNQFVIQEDLVYKLASIVFFDANENPDDWEWKYAIEKIKRWKESESATSFFLHEPMLRLIPFLKGSEANLQAYLEVANAIDAAHLVNLSALLLPGPKTNSLNFTERYFSEEMKASTRS